MSRFKPASYWLRPEHVHGLTVFARHHDMRFEPFRLFAYSKSFDDRLSRDVFRYGVTLGCSCPASCCVARALAPARQDRKIDLWQTI